MDLDIITVQKKTSTIQNPTMVDGISSPVLLNGSVYGAFGLQVGNVVMCNVCTLSSVVIDRQSFVH